MRALILFFAGVVGLWGQFVEAGRGTFIYPLLPYTNFANGTLCTLNDTSANDRAAVMFRWPATGMVTDLIFKTNSVTSSQSLTIAIEGVNTATGLPDETAVVSQTQASVAAFTFYTINFGAGTSVTKNNLAAVAIYFTGTAGNLALTTGTTGLNRDAAVLSICKDAGTYGATTAIAPLLSAKIGSTWYPLGVLGAGGPTSATSFNSGSSPNEYGNRIVPSNWVGRASGILAYFTVTASTSIKGSLYDASGTLVASSPAMAGNVIKAASNTPVYIPFTTPAIVTKGAQYDLVISPQDANSVSLAYEDYTSSTLLNNFAQYSGNIYGVSRGTGGTTYTSRIYYVGLVFDALYAGGGGFMVVQ